MLILCLKLPVEIDWLVVKVVLVDGNIVDFEMRLEGVVKVVMVDLEALEEVLVVWLQK